MKNLFCQVVGGVSAVICVEGSSSFLAAKLQRDLSIIKKKKKEDTEIKKLKAFLESIQSLVAQARENQTPSAELLDQNKLLLGLYQKHEQSWTKERTANVGKFVYLFIIHNIIIIIINQFINLII